MLVLKRTDWWLTRAPMYIVFERARALYFLIKGTIEEIVNSTCTCKGHQGNYLGDIESIAFVASVKYRACRRFNQYDLIVFMTNATIFTWCYRKPRLQEDRYFATSNGL